MCYLFKVAMKGANTFNSFSKILNAQKVFKQKNKIKSINKFSLVF